MRSPDELTVSLEAGAFVTALAYRAEPQTRIGASLVLGHGAGAGQRSPFMVRFAQSLAASGVDIITFDFPYTEQHRRVPDRRPVLEACYCAVIAEVRRHILRAHDLLFAGGKSMGGRIATHIAAADSHLPLAGLVLLGYPLHPPGRPSELRDAHLPAIRRPMLIVQGSRDTFGTPAEFEPLLKRLSPVPTLHVVQGGDHSFKTARVGKSGQEAVDAEVQRTIVDWIAGFARNAQATTRRPD